MERFRPFRFQPRGPRLPSVESIRHLRRTGDPFLIDCGASPFLHPTATPHPRPPHRPLPHFPTSKFRNPESGVLKNCRRARGVLKRPRSVSAMLFLTPF